MMATGVGLPELGGEGISDRSRDERMPLRISNETPPPLKPLLLRTRGFGRPPVRSADDDGGDDDEHEDVEDYGVPPPLADQLIYHGEVPPPPYRILHRSARTRSTTIGGAPDAGFSSDIYRSCNSSSNDAASDTNRARRRARMAVTYRKSVV